MIVQKIPCWQTSDICGLLQHGNNVMHTGTETEN